MSYFLYFHNKKVIIKNGMEYRIFYSKYCTWNKPCYGCFSVSLANGLNEPNMKSRHMCIIAGVFAFFQALMPMLGWVCVYFFVTQFKMFQPFIPWIALTLLLFIGIKMLVDGIKDKDGEEDEKNIII